MAARPTIEFLWFADCPNHPAARELLKDVVARDAPEAEIRDVDATDPAVAERVRFPGSPTIRIDGVDVQPGFEDPADYSPRCRIYWTPSGLARIPAREWIEGALRRQSSRSVTGGTTDARPDGEWGQT